MSDYAHKVYPLPEWGEPCTAEQRARYHTARAYGFQQGMANAAVSDPLSVMGRMSVGYAASLELALAWAMHDGRLPWTTTDVHTSLYDPDILVELLGELCRMYGVDRSLIAPYGQEASS